MTQAAPSAHRILVIDDNHAIHADFRKIFGHGGVDDTALVAAEAALFGDDQGQAPAMVFELDSAFNGPQAVAMVRAALAEGRPYTMAFMDVRMPPGHDGIETTAQIWEHDHDIEIVICTAYSDYSLKEMFGRLGDTERLFILKKPFDTIEILQLAHALSGKALRSKAARQRLQQLEQLVLACTEQLTTTRAQFDQLLESAGAVSWTLSLATGACKTLNGPVASQWGWDPARFAEAGFLHACVHADDRNRFGALLVQAYETGTAELKCRLRRGDGTLLALHVLLRAAPAHQVHGVCIALGVQTDARAAGARLPAQHAASRTADPRQMSSSVLDRERR